jgi:hypothetical protein
MPNGIANLALVAWVPCVLVFFQCMRSSRAAIAAFLLGWMFLPCHAVEFSGFIDITKGNVAGIGALLALLLMRRDCLRTFKPSWIDLPIAAHWLISVASLALNGFSPYAAMAGALNTFLTWTLPYLCGRLFLRDVGAMRELAIGLIIAGLIYMPLCWIELRMSPQLNVWVYGYRQHSFAQTIRFGGYRPTIFMIHGLVVGLFMAMSSVCCVSLYLNRSWSWLQTTHGKLAMFALLATTVLCKSSGAIVLMFLGIAVLLMAKRSGMRLPLIGLFLAGPIYVFLRISNTISGESFINLIDGFNEERARSLSYRIRMETMMMDKAWLKPALGWGSQEGQFLVFDERGQQVSVPDSWWIIQFAANGMLGLAAFLSAILLPGIILVCKWPMKVWRRTAASSVFVIVLCSLMWALDSVFNAASAPALLLILGGLSNLAREN